MKNKEKLALGVVGAIIIAGFIGGSMFFQSSGSFGLNASNQTTDQSQLSYNGGNNNKIGNNKETIDPSHPIETKICPTCKGKKTITETHNNLGLLCSYCKGTGLDPNSLKGSNVKCRVCNGSGFNPPPSKSTVTRQCPTCGGKGRVPA